MTNDLNSWGRLDLTGADTDLPPGDYDATIIKADVFARSDNLWFAVETALTDSGYIPPAQIVALGARGDSPHKKRVADGLRLINQLSKATGVSLPKDLDPVKIQKLFLNKGVRVRCATTRRDGVLELVIRKFLPKAKELAGE